MIQKPIDDPTFKRLVEAVVVLDPPPRDRRWISLSLCIVDAVWTVGSQHETMVVPMVRGLAGRFGVPEPQATVDGPLPADPIPLPRLLALGIDNLTAFTNNERTSPRHGILKSDAALRHASVFAEHGVLTLAHAADLFEDLARFSAVDNAIRLVRGEGSHEIRRNYLWMLIAQDDLVRLDRMVLRWFRHYGLVLDPPTALNVIVGLADSVSLSIGREVTAWEVNYALWLEGRKLPGRL